MNGFTLCSLITVLCPRCNSYQIIGFYPDILGCICRNELLSIPFSCLAKISHRLFILYKAGKMEQCRQLNDV